MILWWALISVLQGLTSSVDLSREYIHCYYIIINTLHITIQLQVVQTYLIILIEKELSEEIDMHVAVLSSDGHGGGFGELLNSL